MLSRAIKKIFPNPQVLRYFCGAFSATLFAILVAFFVVGAGGNSAHAASSVGNSAGNFGFSVERININKPSQVKLDLTQVQDYSDIIKTWKPINQSNLIPPTNWDKVKDSSGIQKNTIYTQSTPELDSLPLAQYSKTIIHRFDFAKLSLSNRRITWDSIFKSGQIQFNLVDALIDQKEKPIYFYYQAQGNEALKKMYLMVDTSGKILAVVNNIDKPFLDVSYVTKVLDALTVKGAAKDTYGYMVNTKMKPPEGLTTNGGYKYINKYQKICALQQGSGTCNNLSNTDDPNYIYMLFLDSALMRASGTNDPSVPSAGTDAVVPGLGTGSGPPPAGDAFCKFGDVSGSIPEMIVGYIINIFSYLLCGLAWLLYKLGLFIMDKGFTNLNETLADISVQLGGEAITTIWKSIISIVNAVALGGLILVAFTNIVRVKMDSYEIKKALPGLVMAVILANFSFLICQEVITFSNAATNAFLGGEFSANAKVDGTAIRQSFSKMEQVTQETLNQSKRKAGESLATTDFNAESPNAHNLKAILYSLAILVAGCLVYALAFMLIIRRYIIFILVSVSPLPFFGLAFPPARKAWDMWWENFWKWTLMTVVAAFWLWLGSLWMKYGLDVSPLVGYLIGVICLYMALTTPFKMSGAFSAATNAWGGFGKWMAYKNPVSQFAKNKATMGAKQKALGWGSNRINRAILNKPGGIMARTAKRIQSFGAKDAAAIELFQGRGEQQRKTIKMEQIGQYLMSKDPFQQKMARGGVIDLGASMASGGETPDAIYNRLLAGVTMDEKGVVSKDGKPLEGEDLANAHAGMLALESIRRNSPVEEYRTQADQMINRAQESGMKNIFAAQAQVAEKTPQQQKDEEDRKKAAEEAFQSIQTHTGAYSDSELASLEQKSYDMEKAVADGERKIEGELKAILEAILTASGQTPEQAKFILNQRQSMIKDLARNPGNIGASGINGVLTSAGLGAVNLTTQQNQELGQMSSAAIAASTRRGQVKVVQNGLDFGRLGHIPMAEAIHADMQGDGAKATNLVMQIDVATKSGDINAMKTVLRSGNYVSSLAMGQLKTDEQVKKKLEDLANLAKTYAVKANAPGGITANSTSGEAINQIRDGWAKDEYRSYQSPATPTPVTVTPPTGGPKGQTAAQQARANARARAQGRRQP